MDVEDRAGLRSDERRAIEGVVAEHGSLHAVVRWGLGQMPPAIVCDVVVQDEFTHDVVVPIGSSIAPIRRAGLHLVYDTT